VELTEQAAVRDIDETREILADLRSHGVSVSIDDFGTGYSSFTSLVKLPVDNLKIDKSFVLNLYEEEQNKRIVEATGQLAHGLELDVIAEGVETEAHIGYLRELGITLMQGFYWTEPLKAQEYQQFVQSFSENGEGSGD
jgi:EAL domain-containing protein (putative c-di-GMP-specific phosphodiesterase class I)